MPAPRPALPSVPPSTTDNNPGRPRQNWILDPIQDALLIIATPLVTLALAVATFAYLGPAQSPTWIITVFIVFNTAHHLPTFIRIYGDVDLFRRFRWSFILGPLVPFTFALGVTSYAFVYPHWPPARVLSAGTGPKSGGGVR